MLKFVRASNTHLILMRQLRDSCDESEKKINTKAKTLKWKIWRKMTFKICDKVI